jgi:hypothetical protein
MFYGWVGGINQTQICNGDNCTQIGIIHNDEVYTMQTSYPKREGPAEFTCSMPEQKHYLKISFIRL